MKISHRNDEQSSFASYNWKLSYEENVQLAPLQFEIPETKVPVGHEWDFLGRRVACPVGIAAGPLLNGNWLLSYARLGYDVLTYKTVRSVARASYKMPNLVPVTGKLSQQGDLHAQQQLTDSWAISFGMPSLPPDQWRRDLERTRKLLSAEKVLVVSVVASPMDDWSIDEIADDYAKCARWAIESGADCVEVNLSCPNVCSADGQLYLHPHASEKVVKRVRTAIGNAPLIAKIGYYWPQDIEVGFELLKAVAGTVDALAMTNCITSRIMDPLDSTGLFDGQTRGIGGRSIFGQSVEQVAMFNKWKLPVDSERRMQLIGVGGIAGTEDAKAYWAAGANFVQIATAAILDPSCGPRIGSELSTASSDNRPVT
ncbi:MAG: hypothetical protein KDB03_19255 [Planctomycetales bacterium]|nr:hypothetical protein [Planctomycetales bacterium]